MLIAEENLGNGVDGELVAKFLRHEAAKEPVFNIGPNEKWGTRSL